MIATYRQWAVLVGGVFASTTILYTATAGDVLDVRASLIQVYGFEQSLVPAKTSNPAGQLKDAAGQAEPSYGQGLYGHALALSASQSRVYRSGGSTAPKEPWPFGSSPVGMPRMGLCIVCFGFRVTV